MDAITLHPIGVIHTPHKEQKGTPVQPCAAQGIEGKIEIFKEYRQALADLQGFDRIWLLFWCHKAKSYHLKVIPYRDVVERGLFSTRAPSRPNSIGLSCVRLLKVDEAAGMLQVADVDMLDGTPLLDVKPYVPRMDSHPNAKAGWLDRADRDWGEADGRFSSE